ncbi:MAG: caspase family protein, partial [Terracidiphilus sp.]
AEPNDLVVIYVATHGTPRTTDTAGGANYLITYDTEVYSGGKLDEDALYATAYPMVELADAVSTRMKALRTAVFLDTCYSGGAAGDNGAQPSAPLANTAPSGAMLKHMSDGTGRIVMAASEVNEESLESSQLHHGYFTYFLLQALKTGKGQTPLSQVYASVAQQVSQSVSSQGMHQHPVMNRSSADADFSLRSPAAATASARP